MLPSWLVEQKQAIHSQLPVWEINWRYYYGYIIHTVSPRPKSFQLVGLFTTDACNGRSLYRGLVSFSCGWFAGKALAVIVRPLVLSGLGITTTPNRVKSVITSKAALQVVRARLIACLDFSALITSLFVWHLADGSLQAEWPVQQSSWHGCYPEWPSWFQPRKDLWDRAARMSGARGLLQF